MSPSTPTWKLRPDILAGSPMTCSACGGAVASHCVARRLCQAARNSCAQMSGLRLQPPPRATH
eukprot:665022-Pyramimonas_sp.AAC.1